MNNFYDYDLGNCSFNSSNDKITPYPNSNINYAISNDIDDSNFFNNNRVNYVPNLNNYKVQFLNNENAINMNKNNAILEPYQGLVKGNLFANLYDPYKNYKPANLNSSNERENMLMQLMQYRFTLIELKLYLDTKPNDREIIKLYNDYLNIFNQLEDKYEKMYGPLTMDSDNFNKNTWAWLEGPWPWEEI